MIIIMSGLNGIVEVISSVYDSFDPDIEFTLKEGKTFDVDEIDLEEIESLEGVSVLYSGISEITMMKYGEQYAFATMVGVDDIYFQTELISRNIEAGLGRPSAIDEYALIGAELAQRLQVNLSLIQKLEVHGLLRTEKMKATNQDAFLSLSTDVGGVFNVNPEYNTKYFIVPISFARDLLQYESNRTSLNVIVKEGVDVNEIKTEVLLLLGDEFKGVTRYEQNEMIFKTNETEKWIVFMILGFIMIIATFNIIASLTMLIMDKRKDIRTLIAVGAEYGSIRNIFILQGAFINVVGAVLGIALGFTVCWLQETYHLVTLENSIVDYWPISIKLLDVLAIFGLIILVGLLTSILPVWYLMKKHFGSLSSFRD